MRINSSGRSVILSWPVHGPPLFHVKHVPRLRRSTCGSQVGQFGGFCRRWYRAAERWWAWLEV